MAVSPLPALLTGVATKVVDMDMDRGMVLDMAGNETEDHRTGEDGRNRAHPLSALTWEILSTENLKKVWLGRGEALDPLHSVQGPSLGSQTSEALSKEAPHLHFFRFTRLPVSLEGQGARLLQLQGDGLQPVRVLLHLTEMKAPVTLLVIIVNIDEGFLAGRCSLSSLLTSSLSCLSLSLHPNQTRCPWMCSRETSPQHKDPQGHCSLDRHLAEGGLWISPKTTIPPPLSLSLSQAHLLVPKLKVMVEEKPIEL